MENKDRKKRKIKKHLKEHGDVYTLLFFIIAVTVTLVLVCVSTGGTHEKYELKEGKCFLHISDEGLYSRTDNYIDADMAKCIQK